MDWESLLKGFGFGLVTIFAEIVFAAYITPAIIELGKLPGFNASMFLIVLGILGILDFSYAIFHKSQEYGAGFIFSILIIVSAIVKMLPDIFDGMLVLVLITLMALAIRVLKATRHE